MVFTQLRTSTISDCAVATKKGTILSIGPTNRIINKYPGHRVYRLENAVLMPGLVNLHTHLELPPLLNAIRAKTFPDWVINLITAKKQLTVKNFKTAAKENINNLIHTGVTTVGEICTDNVSRGLLKISGLRAVIFQEIINMPSRARRTISPTRDVRILKVRPSGLIRYGISPHALYTVSQPILLQLKNMAEHRDLKMSMHIAESKDEIRLLNGNNSGLNDLYQYVGWDQAWAPRGSSSFEYLDRIGILSPHLLAVHAVHVTDKDIEIIKKSKVSVSHFPRINSNLGVGRMPLKKFLDAGITVGLGTDSLASSPNLSMWDEMRYAHWIHRRDGITPRDIFRLAMIGGAKALGLNNEIGTIEPGKKADIIAVPLPSKNTGDLYADLLRETKSCIMNMVNGKILYRHDDGERL